MICEACGTQYEPAPEPPAACMICADDRQYVGWDGQRWTSHEELASRLHLRIEPDGHVLGVGIEERFAIPQRALLLDTDAGTILWDCLSVVTDAAVEQLRQRGGIDLIAISHPHFYAAMVEWSEAFGAPILIHEADNGWVQRRSPALRTWGGDRLDLSPTVALLHLPGHFPGSSALHWSDGPDGRSLLAVGDSLHVAADRCHVSVMHSVPNHIPVGPTTISDLRHRLDGVAFDDLYGFTWGLNIIGQADEAVARSLHRYHAAVTA
jgi:hypothetical protein